MWWFGNKLLKQTLANTEKIMAAIDDLKTQVGDLATNVADLSTSVAAETADIEAALAVITNPTASDVDIESAAQGIAASITVLKAQSQAAKDAAAKIKAAVPTAP